MAENFGCPIEQGLSLKIRRTKPASCSCVSSCRVPELSYDWKTHSGRKFNYFSYGAACSEVEIDCLTGDHQVRICSLCVLRYPDLTCGLEHYRTLLKREIYVFPWQCDDPISSVRFLLALINKL